MNERFKQAKKVTLVGAAANALLGIIKLIGGFLFHSHALVADGFHSFSDLITDTMVFFASKYGSQSADDSHPYGHQRFETAATFMLALILVLTGIGIAWDAIHELLAKDYSPANGWALPVAILSIVINECLFHYTQYIGRKINSPLVIANAWHHRSDAASSAIVVIGLVGSLLGYFYFDTLAAIIVGLMIVKMGLNYGWNSIKELVDTAVEYEMLAKIQNIIQAFDGVKKIHQLRSRLMGGDIFIDVHILVSPFISVSEGHYIAQQVHHVLLDKLDKVKDVTVHVDPEDDEETTLSINLPNRQTIEQKLIDSWKQQFPMIKNWTLHYLDGQVTIDLICSDGNQYNELADRIAADLKGFSAVKTLRLFNEIKVISHEKPHHHLS